MSEVKRTARKTGQVQSEQTKYHFRQVDVVYVLVVCSAMKMQLLGNNT